MMKFPMHALQYIAQTDKGAAEELAASMREVGDITSLPGHWCRACSVLLDAFAYETLKKTAADHTSTYGREATCDQEVVLGQGETTSGQEAAPNQEIESKFPKDFDFDFSSIEIPKSELSDEEAASLATKLLSAFSEPDENEKPRVPKPQKARRSRASRK